MNTSKLEKDKYWYQMALDFAVLKPELFIVGKQMYYQCSIEQLEVMMYITIL